MIKKLLGIAPQPTKNGAYTPSPVALKLATSEKTNYDGTSYENPNQNQSQRILMLCTEGKYMTMSNDKQFSTGNHPVEMFVPILHLEKAGFQIDVFTPSGKPVKIEKWALPKADDKVMSIYESYKDRLQQPNSLADFIADGLGSASDYIGLFIPGGHGAMLGLPDDQNVARLIRWAHESDLIIGAICHGPAALLAVHENEAEDFIFKGYKMAAFPDMVDKITPYFGYMPGQLTWQFGQRLEDLGVEIINKMADNTCYHDRNLITGASPLAANDFGKMVAEALLERVNSQVKNV